MIYQGQGWPGVFEHMVILRNTLQFEIPISDEDKERIRISIRNKKQVKKK